MGRSREAVAKKTGAIPGIAPRIVQDVSMLTKWNLECRSYIVLCISMVAPRIVLDGSCVVQSNTL